MLVKDEHISHLKIVLSEFLNHGIIISKNKAKFFKKNIEFLGTEIGQGKIKLQPHNLILNKIKKLEGGNSNLILEKLDKLEKIILS